MAPADIMSNTVLPNIRSAENLESGEQFSTQGWECMQLTGRSRRESPRFRGCVAKDAKTRGLSADSKHRKKEEEEEAEEDKVGHGQHSRLNYTTRAADRSDAARSTVGFETRPFHGNDGEIARASVGVKPVGELEGAGGRGGGGGRAEAAELGPAGGRQGSDILVVEARREPGVGAGGAVGVVAGSSAGVCGGEQERESEEAQTAEETEEPQGWRGGAGCCRHGQGHEARRHTELDVLGLGHPPPPPRSSPAAHC
jgi:hypothetical protein